MEQSILRAETLWFWKISRDLKRPDLSQRERQELADEMEGFAMNAENRRLRRLAASSLEALASSIRAESTPQERGTLAGQNPGLGIEVTKLSKGWEELRIVAPVAFTKRVQSEFMALALAEAATAKTKG